MATMREIVEDAMEEIGVKTAEIALQSDELQAGIRRCNDMLTEWADSGAIYGYTEVLNGDDVVDVDRNAIGTIKYNLAIRCAPSFQKLITPALQFLATSTFDALLASNTDLSNIAYPDTLPLGSGNQCPSNDTDIRFFPNNKPDNF